MLRLRNGIVERDSRHKLQVMAAETLRDCFLFSGRAHAICRRRSTMSAIIGAAYHTALCNGATQSDRQAHPLQAGRPANRSRSWQLPAGTAIEQRTKTWFP